MSQPASLKEREEVLYEMFACLTIATVPIPTHKFGQAPDCRGDWEASALPTYLQEKTKEAFKVASLT